MLAIVEGLEVCWLVEGLVVCWLHYTMVKVLGQLLPNNASMPFSN